MQLEVGKIVEGKVTGITKFGAFVELEPGKVGMVHISEVAPVYVNDISEHLTEGQQVTVKVLAIGEDGKISLSIKRAMKPTPRRDSPNRDFQRQNRDHRDRDNRDNHDNRGRRDSRDGDYRGNRNNNSRPNNYGNNRQGGYSKAAQKPTSFEDMLSKFMQSSDEKISDIKKAREVSRKSGQRRSH